MIAVIADDFTGAAELAGIALRYDLSVKLYTGAIAYGNADLVVVSTDSRSMHREEAMAITEKVLQNLLHLQPLLVYKKVDSVLRGHVLDELDIQMRVLNLHSAWLLPANPSLGRTIRSGNYYVQEVPVHETGFATDPEFAIHSSLVKEMLHAGDRKDVQVCGYHNTLPDTGILIGEAASQEDMKAWALRANSSMAMAGAGDFFEALLQKIVARKPRTTPADFLSPHLYISGTTFALGTEQVARFADTGIPVHYLDETLVTSQRYDIWLQKILNSLRQVRKAVIAIEPRGLFPENISALHLRTSMARSVQVLLDHAEVPELFIEGGSTAAAILESLGITEFIPLNEVARGVIRMKAADRELFLTVKPGSYALPDTILQLYTQTATQPS